MVATLLPSAEQVMVAWLKAQADVTAITGGRTGTKLNAVLPALRVTRIGGSPDEVWKDNPSLQVEAWAVDQATADLLIRTVVACLPAIRGYAYAGRVYTYAVSSGPFWAPDDPALSSNSRYIIQVDLLVTS